MKREKSNILSRRPESIIFMLFIGFVSVLLNFTFSQNTFAEYKAKLSASISESTASIDGTEIIESSDETAEHEINLKINTTNKTGYTATLSSKTDETALLNTNPAITSKISSISSVSSLSNFPANTWGYSFNTNTDFNPIPALSTPANLIHTTEKSASEENHIIKLGMKLNSSLKPGNYENKLIISVVSNSYTPKAIMTEGQDFNKKLKALETATNKIEHFKNSTVAPAASMNAVNIEDEDSDYEIKLWLDPTDKTAYYYAETEKVYLNEDSSRMFYYNDIIFPADKMKDILDIDLSNFDTSNVTDMGAMFYGMSNLTSLNLSNFDTSRVTDMSSMFTFMYNLTTLNLSNFDTSKVTDMGNMFQGLKLTSLDLSNFNTSNVTDMSIMFANMPDLTTLDLSNFDTSNVTDMGAMFQNMYSLKILDISNFDISKVESMSYTFAIFHDHSTVSDKLEKIYVNNDFNTSQLTNFSDMFRNRRKLRGGAGSFLTDPSTADKTWLRIDDPTHGRPGYFTRKP